MRETFQTPANSIVPNRRSKHFIGKIRIRNIDIFSKTYHKKIRKLILIKKININLSSDKNTDGLYF
jgi:hypothetical protein